MGVVAVVAAVVAAIGLLLQVRASSGRDVFFLVTYLTLAASDTSATSSQFDGTYLRASSAESLASRK